MVVAYTTYEAKARLSEIVRKVRAGQRVVISYRGQDVAEVRPIEAERSLEATLRRHREQGTVGPAGKRVGDLRPAGRRPGALKRFLESRD